MAKLVWDRHAIGAEVKRRGLTLEGIATKHGLYLSACKEALSRGNRRGEKALSDELGIPLDTLRAALKRDHKNRADHSHNLGGSKRKKRGGVPDKGRASA